MERERKRVYRLTHREEIQAAGRVYAQAHRKERRAYYVAHRQEALAYSRAYTKAHPEEKRAYYRSRYRNMLAEAMHCLGSKCACPGCDESEQAFLTIDHIHGRAKGSGHSALWGAKASGWDKTKFQILCYNCNCAKKDRGFCPVHQTRPGLTNGHTRPINDQQAIWV